MDLQEDYKIHWTESAHMLRPRSKLVRRKYVQNSTEVDAKTNESTRKSEKDWMEGIKNAMNERNLNEGQWEDRKRWSLGVGQRRKVLKPTYIYIYTGCPRRKGHYSGRS
jgi:hypothetical protein